MTKEKNCIACGELIDSTLQFCPFCGAEQPMAVQSNVINKKMKDRIEVVSTEDLAVPIEVKDFSSIEKKNSKAKEKKQEDFKNNSDTEELDWLAYHDKLTELGNRALFEKELKNLDQKNGYVFYVDANKLKNTNDKYGHKYGDLLLVSVSSALKETFPKEKIFRIGGDEFVVIGEGIKDLIADKRIEKFKEILKGKSTQSEFEISASIGFASGDGIKSVKEILEEAESKMYEEKKNTRDSRMFSEGYVYDPNYDGYYDDVKAEYEETRKEYDAENIRKAAVIIGTAIILLVGYYWYVGNLF